jgi:thioredoxin reductase (NADPH)
MQERLFQNPKIKLIWNSELAEVLGTSDPPGVTGAKLRNLVTGELTEVDVDGVFIAIGHKPATDLFVGQIEMKPSGYIATAPHSTATSVPGVFAAGDVADEVYRQAVTAAGLGCMAALDAEKFLAGIEQPYQPAEVAALAFLGAK